MDKQQKQLSELLTALITSSNYTTGLPEDVRRKYNVNSLAELQALYMQELNEHIDARVKVAMEATR